MGFEYFGDVRTVDVTIRRLREKIEENPSKPEYILTRRGLGYLMRAKTEACNEVAVLLPHHSGEGHHHLCPSYTDRDALIGVYFVSAMKNFTKDLQERAELNGGRRTRMIACASW